MSDRTPYTYFVLHIPTGLKYYGSKYGKGADPKTFWKPGGYFTSSVKVKKLLEDYGSDTFRAEVRKTFMSPDQALKYEYKFLHKVKALTKDFPRFGYWLLPRRKIDLQHVQFCFQYFDATSYCGKIWQSRFRLLQFCSSNSLNLSFCRSRFGFGRF